VLLLRLLELLITSSSRAAAVGVVQRPIGMVPGAAVQAERWLAP
jgi:hypothetical protein